jgi:opacity protein-like surface antigen
MKKIALIALTILLAAGFTYADTNVVSASTNEYTNTYLKVGVGVTDLNGYDNDMLANVGIYKEQNKFLTVGLNVKYQRIGDGDYSTDDYSTTTTTTTTTPGTVGTDGTPGTPGTDPVCPNKPGNPDAPAHGWYKNNPCTPGTPDTPGTPGTPGTDGTTTTTTTTTSGTAAEYEDGDTGLTTITAQFLLDWKNDTILTPYGTAGFGFSLMDNDQNSSVAWNGGLGVLLAVSDNISLDVSAMYVSDFDEDDIELEGMNYTFGVVSRF